MSERSAGALLHERPCRPLASTIAPHGHEWVWHGSRLNLKPTATIIASKSRPHEEIGTTCCQSLLWGFCTAKSLALSISIVACSTTSLKSLITVILFQARWVLSLPSWEQETPLTEIHTSRADATYVSGASPHATRSAFWRSAVLAADAKKAGSASEVPRRMPKPPLRIGKLAWIHCVPVSDELVMELIASRSKSYYYYCYYYY